MNEIYRNNNDFNILYVKGDEFANQMIEAIAHGSTESFRRKYRKADVLLIDDIQFIAGKESTQEEFFHTFNALYEDGKQIIMTSDRPPRDIPKLADRLRTRFEWGLIADIQPPDYELRIAIMQNKARMLGLTLPPDVLAYMAENIKSDIRQIEGAVKKISARCYLSKEPITLELAKECASTFIKNETSPLVTMDTIISHIAKKYGLAVDDILGRQRIKSIARARNISIFVIRKLTGLSQSVIGTKFDRDRTTILSSYNAVEDEMKKNPLFDIEITELMKEIQE
jgi:chromosomal replication initiator protein